jgi:membrane protein
MGMVERAKNAAARVAAWPPAALGLSVHQRVGELGGGFLASALTLSLFLSLFPLLLVALAVLGFLNAGNESMAADLVAELGLTGDAADFVVEGLQSAEDSRAATSILGFLGLLWASLGVVGAVQHICGRAWQVAGRGLIGKAVAFLWLIGALAILGASFTLGGLLPRVPGWLAPVQVAGGVLLVVGFFLFTFRLLTPRSLPWRDHLPGALLGGVGVHLLTLLTTMIVPRQAAASSALYGSIGVVFALLAWLLLFGRLLVYAVALNVVLHERAHGTVRVEVEAPRFRGEGPVAADRSAVVQDRSS